jgi:hypothetical protein
MLKGSLDVDIELMGGSIVFIALTSIMFFSLLWPLLVIEYNLESNEGEMRAVEFANLVKSRLTERIGNGRGDIVYEKLEAMEGRGLTELGLANNYVRIENLTDGSSFEFGTGRSENKHDVFATISSSYSPVVSESTRVMAGGEEYLIHIYNTSEDGMPVAFDVYPEYICSQASGQPVERGKYRTVGCDEISGLAKENVGAGDLRNMISLVRSTGTSKAARVVAQGDITAGNLFATGLRFGKTWECQGSGLDYICFRVMGDFVFPVKIHVEVGKGGEIAVKTS